MNENGLYELVTLGSGSAPYVLRRAVISPTLGPPGPRDNPELCMSIESRAEHERYIPPVPMRDRYTARLRVHLKEKAAASRKANKRCPGGRRQLFITGVGL